MHLKVLIVYLRGVALQLEQNGHTGQPGGRGRSSPSRLPAIAGLLPHLIKPSDWEAHPRPVGKLRREQQAVDAPFARVTATTTTTAVTAAAATALARPPLRCPILSS